MNSCRIFVFTVIAVLAALTKQSNGLNVTLCLGLLGGCQTEKPTVEETNPKLVLQNGFWNANNTLASARNKAMDGLALARALVITRPRDAAQALQEAIRSAKETFYDSGVPALLALGKTLAFTNELARKGLAGSCLGLQLPAMELIETFTTVDGLAVQGVSPGGSAANQALESAVSIMQGGFGSMFYSIEISFQQANKAISDNQQNSLQVQDENQNAANDTDTLDAISKVNKAAEIAINNGASADKVNRLKSSIKSLLCDLAQIASHVRDYIEHIQILADTDPSAAKKIFLEETDVVYRKTQEICSQIFLDFGVAGADSGILFQSKIPKAFLAIEHGTEEVAVGIKVSKKCGLLGFEYQGNIRSVLLTAAVQSAIYAKIALDQRIVEGATLAFSAL